MSFAVLNDGGGFYWPRSSVTVSIFSDASGTLGSAVYSNTFTSFTDTVVLAPVIGGNDGVDVVGVVLPSLNLAAGTYDIFMTNQTNMALPLYEGYLGSGGMISDANGSPAQGDAYSNFGVSAGYDTAVQLSTDTLSASAPTPGEGNPSVYGGLLLLAIAARYRGLLV
jgi:hypothetical protein